MARVHTLNSHRLNFFLEAHLEAGERFGLGMGKLAIEPLKTGPRPNMGKHRIDSGAGSGDGAVDTFGCEEQCPRHSVFFTKRLELGAAGFEVGILDERIKRRHGELRWAVTCHSLAIAKPAGGRKQPSTGSVPFMAHFIDQLTIATDGPGLYEFTHKADAFVRRHGADGGLLTVFCRHTSASLLIQENADPDVQADLSAFFRRLVPEGDPLYRHVLEGPDDMPAHVKAALTATSIGIPVASGRMALGTWQGLYLFEHRRRPHTRSVVLHLAAG